VVEVWEFLVLGGGELLWPLCSLFSRNSFLNGVQTDRAQATCPAENNEREENENKI